MNYPSWLWMLINKWPDLVVTFLGISLGGLFAFVIAKWGINKQTKNDIEKGKYLLGTKLDRVKIEIRDNRNRVQQLISALDNSQASRADLLAWATAIVNSFSTSDYDRLMSTGLQKNSLPWGVEQEIYGAYDDLAGLSHMVEQACATQNIHLVGKLQFQNVKTYSNTILTGLNKAVNVIYEYVKTLTGDKE